MARPSIGYRLYHRAQAVIELARDGPDAEPPHHLVAPVSAGNWTETDEHHISYRDFAHDARAHGRRAARSARRVAPRGAHDRPGAHDGGAARGPPLADPLRPRAMRPRGRLAVREPGSVQRALGPRALPAT